MMMATQDPQKPNRLIQLLVGIGKCIYLPLKFAGYFLVSMGAPMWVFRAEGFLTLDDDEESPTTEEKSNHGR